MRTEEVTLQPQLLHFLLKVSLYLLSRAHWRAVTGMPNMYLCSKNSGYDSAAQTQLPLSVKNRSSALSQHITIVS